MIKGMFNGATIGKRLMLFIVSVVLLPTAIVLVLFYSQFYNILRDSLLDSQIVTSLQASKFIGNTAETLLAVCDNIIEDKRLPILLFAQSPRDGQSANYSNEYNAAFDTLRTVINSQIKSNSLSAIRIFADMPGLEANGASSGLISDLSHIKNTYWYGIFTTQDISELFAPNFYLSADERVEYGSLAVIRKQVFEKDGNSITVFVAVYTYDDILVTPIQDIGLESVEGIISFIINSREAVVAQTDETAYGTYAMSYRNIAQAIPAQGVFIPKDVAGASVFITYRDISRTDWRMAWIVPQASIMAQSRHVIFQLVVIYLLMTMLVLIVGVVLSKAIVVRIKSLRNQMQLIKTERPKPLAIMPGKDEVGDLIEAYNYMVERINTLLDNTIKAADERKAEEIKALRAQIDPHFLYNTLDMIRWLVSKGNNDKALEAILALSRFYRLTLNSGNLTTTVAAELEHVSLYVKLMNMRFDEKIEYLADIPDDMLEYEVPPMIFQPIIENSIQHGIFERPSKSGKIIITGWSDNNTLHFLISDDGIGMKAEQISRLMPTKTDEGTGRGIGVYNTHRRLQLMQGRDDCGLFYSSEYGKGTDVTFKIHKSAALRRPGGKADEKA
ncbi:MAG: histidine kinase [Clostridiales bacterium]|jgi:two-component system sensor histidine kinase YesM|nr:histidine kinase [Clostridiales bacterium]